jgi:spore coat polysaccharide biosynthesis protein SpsF (cytidylyltransferase family)
MEHLIEKKFEEELFKVNDIPPRIRKQFSKKEKVRSNGRQRPSFFYFEGLTAKPWHDKKDFEWIIDFENDYKIIQKEYLKLEKDLFKEIKNSVEGDWRQFNFVEDGKV